MATSEEVRFRRGRRLFTWVSLGIGALAFFLPLVSVRAPIVGDLQWSTLNIISEMFGASEKGKPSFSRIVSKPTSEMSSEAQDSEVNSKAKNSVLNSEVQDSKQRASRTEIPVGLRLAAFFPFTVAFCYMSLVAACITVVFAYAPRTIVLFSFLGLASALYSLIAVFLLSDSLQSQMRQSMAGTESNIFSALGQVLTQSVRVEPGLGLYSLVLCFLSMLLVQYLSGLDRLSLRVE